MPWRLILFIVVFALFLLFIGFNLGDEFKCKINFGFAKTPPIPVFFPIFVSFALGLLCSFPFALNLRKRKEMSRQNRNQIDDDSYDAPDDSEVSEKIKQDAASAKERFFLKRLGGKK